MKKQQYVPAQMEFILSDAADLLTTSYEASGDGISIDVEELFR